MFKLFLMFSLVFSFVTSLTPSSDIVLPVGTELPLTNTTVIDSATMKVGAEANFVLAVDVPSKVGTILKGSVVYGRIVEVNKFSKKTGKSSIVMSFDFLQSGEEFYSLKAAVIDSGAATENLKLAESDTFENATLLTKKGSEIQIPEGSEFKIRISEDCKTDDP